ncbi:hypothetical protein AKJ16_DCAP01768 [Drosera capensis]
MTSLSPAAYSHSSIPNQSKFASSCSSPHLLSLLETPWSTKPTKLKVAAQSIPSHDGPVIVGCGGASMDYLVLVDAFPKPDEKIRLTGFKIQGGGNVGNALTCAARLGLRPRDSEGQRLMEELEGDGVDTSFILVSEEGRSMFSHVIVDTEMKTRTAIYHPGYPPMTPDDISPARLSSVLDGAQLAYFDGLSITTALLVGRAASTQDIPILVDAEMGEEGFEELLRMASYAVCSAKYPQAWTKVPSMPAALVSMLLSLPKLRFVIVALGENGCIMLRRNQEGMIYLDKHVILNAMLDLSIKKKDFDALLVAENMAVEEMDIDQCIEDLKLKLDPDTINPTCASSPVLKLTANGIGTVVGRLSVGTAERIPPSELVDTTGAGDAFIGAVMYGLCTKMAPEKMLPFAAKVAASCCRALGARTNLPHGTDRSLDCFLQRSS